MTDNSSPTSQRWLRLLFKTGSVLGLGLFAIVVVGLLYGQWWAQRNLAPIIAQELTKSLKRPVKVGEIESVWLNRIEIGKTAIPATGNDPSNLSIDRVVASFDPLKLILAQTLKLDIEVNTPNIYLAQNSQGNWLNIPDRQKTPPGPVKIEVGKIDVNNAKVVVVPDGKNARSVEVSQVNVTANISDSQQQVNFNSNALFERTGKIEITGQSLLTNGKTEFTIATQKVDAAAITRLYQIPQVKIASGTVDGKLNVAILPQQPLRFDGKLFVNDGKLIVDRMPRSLDRINGYIQLSDRDLKLENVALKYDRVNAIANGNLNFKTGFDLTAKTAPTALADLTKSLSIKSPFTLAGATSADLKLTGKLNQPILAGTFQNNQPIRVDRLSFDRINGNFRLADGAIKTAVTAQPKLGGKVAAQGAIQLLKTSQMRFQVRGEGLPADALALLYGAKLPPKLKLGVATVVGTIGGASGEIYTNLRVNAPQATYPTVADLQITPQGKVRVSDATIRAAGGSVKIAGEVDKNNWQFTARPQQLTASKLATTAGFKLPPNYDGNLSGTIRAAGSSKDLELNRLQAQGDLRLQLAAGEIVADRLILDRGNWQAQISSKAIDLQKLDRRLPSGMASGNFQLNGSQLNQVNIDNLVANGSGKVKLASGTIESSNLNVTNGNWQGTFIANNLQLAKLNPQVNGNLTGQFQLAGSLKSTDPTAISGMGMGKIDLPQGRIVANNMKLDRGKWQSDLQASALVIGGLIPKIPAQYQNARLTGNATVTGDLNQLQLVNITAQGKGKLSLDGGNIVADRVALNAGRWQGNFALDRFKIGSVSDKLPQGLQAARLSGNFAAAGNLAKLDPAQLMASGAGILAIGNGQIRATNLNLDRGKWSSNLAISNLQIGQFTDRLSPQLQAGKLTGNFQVAGNLARLQPAAIAASGNGSVKLANGGNIVANNMRLDAGKWRSNLAIRSLKLGDVNQALAAPIQTGLLTGNFQVAGNLDRLTPAAVQVNGNGQIQNILGGKVSVADLAVTNGRWRSKVKIDRLNLRELAKFAPNKQIDPNLLIGQLSANWQIAGSLQDRSPANLQVIGATKLTNLQVGSLKFDPNLNGKIQANPGQGVDINFDGANDRLALSLDRNFQLQSFNIDRQGVIAKGSTIVDPISKNRLLDINVERFPLALFQAAIPASAGIGQYRFNGTATGNLAINLSNYAVTGKQIEIMQPTFGAFQGDRLLANFSYANGEFKLDNTTIQNGENNYLINASAIPGAATPTFQANIQVPKGSLADVRNIFQIFSFTDLVNPLNRRSYGAVGDLDLPTDRIASRPLPLYEELRRLAELNRLIDRQERRKSAATSIPSLQNLTGDFSGELTIASNPQAGLSAKFDLNGTQWQLERYHLDRLVAKGDFNRGQLQLEPSTIDIKDTQMTLVGKFGAGEQNGSLSIQKFPADWLAKVTKLPVKVQGDIDLATKISGTLGNPRLDGNLIINNAKLNQTQLQTATGKFNYADGRMEFDSSGSFVRQLRPEESDDTIKIAGSIPYQLPFTLKSPASDRVKIDVSLQDRGLQLIDAFTNNQLTWLDGQGKVAVAIDGKMGKSGKIENLVASGIAMIANGKIKSANLPEPVRNINGEIAFDFDRIDVRKLDGVLDRGKVAIVGILPISDSFSIDPSKQLNVSLDGVAIDLKDKYKGDVNGKLTVLGTAVKPKLTGELKLTNGQISIPESPNATSTILGVTPAPTTTEDTPSPEPNNSIQLSDLKLILGDNIQITRAPILNFVATGTLDIDGTLSDLRPFGQVQLQKGVVNIFTTQFRLGSGPQTANFFPTLGTDPVLNLQLVSKVLESTSNSQSQRNSIAQTVTNGEINRPANFDTTSFGSVQTVQVEAKIAGLASQITQRLELTSTPARTQAEIALLLGGGLAQQLGSGDIGLGIANIAGSNILSTIQDRIGDIFSLSDFRLFPTVTQAGNSNNSASTFGIAAEVGTEITPKVSASVFKILTNQESLYYSLRYRINDQLLLRGSTNLFGENRAILEFQQRF